MNHISPFEHLNFTKSRRNDPFSKFGLYKLRNLIIHKHLNFLRFRGSESEMKKLNYQKTLEFRIKSFQSKINSKKK